MSPVRTIGSELVAVVRRHKGISGEEAKREAVEWLARVRLPDPARRMDDLPHRMSGGMRQRAMLALALAGSPRLLVADEPTTALDVTVQAQILALLGKLRDELGLALLLVTHDLGVVAEIADRAMVMYAGEIVEKANVEALFRSPAHPYTRALLGARPAPGAKRGTRLPAVEGSVPEPGSRPEGCAFSDRCPEVFDRCRLEHPRLQPAGDSSSAACFLVEEAKVESR